MLFSCLLNLAVSDDSTKKLSGRNSWNMDKQKKVQQFII